MNSKFSLIFMPLLLILSMLSTPLFATNDMSIIAEFQGEHHYSGYGNTLESLDFNGDGYTDLAVFSQSYGYTEGVGGRCGKVYIYYGGPNFCSATNPSLTLTGATDRAILNMYNVGDINGDGYDDLCVYDYAPLPSREDIRIRFYFGGRDDLDYPDHVIFLPWNSYVLRVSKIGDFDGDGFGDVGLHYVLRQPPAVQKYSIMWGGSLEEEIILEYTENNAISSICGIGDINGDGYKDFSLGFTNPDPITGYHKIRIYHGNPDRDFSDYDVLIQTQEPITKDCRPIGDVNGDGFDDFMGYYSNDGMHAWLGGTNIAYDTPSFNFLPGWSGDVASRCLKFGDLNGDGFDDVVGTNYNQGRFSVWMGSEQMNGTSDLIKISGYDNFGYGIAVGDFNADGFCDIAIGAHKPSPYSNDRDFRGYVFIYGGNEHLQDTTVSNDDLVAPQVKDQLHISISPNPVRTSDGVALLTATSKKPLAVIEGTLSIFNIKGQLVYRENIPVNHSKVEHNINLQQFATGIYLCQMSLGEKQATKKLIIIK